MMLWGLGLRYFIRSGHLSVIDVHGKRHAFGPAGSTPACTIRLHNSALHYQLLLRPGLYLGEAFTNGTLTIEQGTLYDLLSVLGINLRDQPVTKTERFRDSTLRLAERLFTRIKLAAAKENVAHHYDLSGDLYRQFFDENMQYSCAYFTSNDVSLEQAQLDKKRHIAAKLLLKPGMRVLDIGCGWGGMALYLARNFGVDVTGLTLSEEQLAVAQKRARDAGFSDRVRFHLLDYRQEHEQYDRIVSVGMFEHVGINHYTEFFSKLKSLLKTDGVALIHSIGRMDGPGVTSAWLKKYIFPGGYAPAMSEVLPVIEKLGLWTTDIEVLRLHYAETLKHWRERFQAHRAQIAALYDERFCRMWDFYLCACEIDFRLLSTMVFQLQITKDIEAVPLTRDYMFDAECAQERVHAAA